MSAIGFIGAGNMATSLIGGLLASGVSPQDIRAADPAAPQPGLAGITTLTDNRELADWADTIILAVKPQVMRSVCHQIADIAQTRRPLLISVAAGIRTGSICDWLGYAAAVVRVMPNTPALIGQGMSGLYAPTNVSEEQRARAQKILQAVGQTAWLDDEAHMDAVTAISGSGPAYFFLLMEAMIAAGTEQGLPPELATQLTLQTALGAAGMASQSDVNPSELRRRVTSPGGTTEQAIETFHQGGFMTLVNDALQAASRRSRELSEQLGSDSGDKD